MRFLAVAAVFLALQPVASRAQQDPIDALLSERARAVIERDERAFRATMAGAPAAFVAARLRWFRALGGLDLAVYRLERDPTSNASYPARRRPGFDRTTVIGIRETLALKAEDVRRPQVLPHAWTFGERGGTWSVIADDELADVGLLPWRDLWDLGPVRTLSDRGITVITRGPLAQARTLAANVARARDFVQERWPFGVPDKVVVLVPGSTAEASRMFNDTFDVSNFRGFASSTVHRDDGEVVYGGHRLMVNAGNFFAAPDRDDILSHEMLHLAAARRTGPHVPTWMEEGYAQVFGERVTRSDPNAVSLPEDHVFHAGTSAQIGRAYDASDLFVRFLVRRSGRSPAARFFVSLGAVGAVNFGTSRYHQDRVAREVLGASIGVLSDRWRRAA